VNDNFQHINGGVSDDLHRMMQSCGSESGFNVPQGYFEMLKSEILLKSLDCDKEMELEIPENYFEEAQGRILSAVDHQVTETFFQDQQERILSEIKIQEYKSDQDFIVPVGYFEQSGSAIMSQAKAAKVIALKAWFAYGAAAVALIAALFFFFPDKNADDQLSFAELVEKNPIDEDDLEYFTEEEDVFEVYLALMDEDTTAVDSLKVVQDEMLAPIDSTNKMVKLDPKTGLPMDTKKTKTPVSWDQLSDEELLEYLFEEGDEELLNDFE
jgi:hypothetical protein